MEREFCIIPLLFEEEYSRKYLVMTKGKWNVLAPIRAADEFSSVEIEICITLCFFKECSPYILLRDERNF